jgi:hypothetical protein
MMFHTSKATAHLRAGIAYDYKRPAPRGFDEL